MMFYNSIIMKNKSNLENSSDFSSFGISLASRSTIKDSILNFLSKFVSLKIIKIFMEKNFLEFSYESTNICNVNCSFCGYRFMKRKKTVLNEYL